MALSKFLDPKNDVAFKKIFGNEDNKNILIHFINDILGLEGQDTVETVQFFLQSRIQKSPVKSKA